MQRSNLFKPAIISSLICLFSFIVVRFADTLILAGFLRLNNIEFKFSLFSIEYVQGGQANWTEGKVILIYTLPYLFFALLGVYLPHLLRRKHNLWLQLMITWLSFQMMLLVMSGLAAGIFQFKGIGVSLEWLFVNMPVKVIGVLIMLMLLFVAARRFGWYFLRKVPDRIYHDDFDYRRLWLNKAVLLPFIISFAFIFPMSGLHTWLNFVFSFVLGLLFIAVIYRTIPIVYIP